MTIPINTPLAIIDTNTARDYYQEDECPERGRPLPEHPFGPFLANPLTSYFVHPVLLGGRPRPEHPTTADVDVHDVGGTHHSDGHPARAEDADATHVHVDPAHPDGHSGVDPYQGTGAEPYPHRIEAVDPDESLTVVDPVVDSHGAKDPAP